MRILFLTNFFPPARSGGYTQWCHEVAECLARRGHQIGVLTSRHDLNQVPVYEKNVFRLLHLEGDLSYYQPLQFFIKWKKQQRENLAYLENAIKDFSPDLVFIWGMWALSKSLPARAEQLLPGRVVYFLSDYWPSAIDMHTSYWQLPARRGFVQPIKGVLGKMAKSMLAKEAQINLKLEKVICVSAAVREHLQAAGLPVQHAKIIYGGTDAGRFPNPRERDHQNGQRKLLYAGQLVQHKGVHTAIEALSKLVHEMKIDEVTLTLVGSGHPDYEAFLHEIVERERLQGHVTFHDTISKDEIPRFFQEFDVLVFPSIYDEPLARITQEAMLSCLVVVGTATGGTSEILRDGENGLTFAPEDADGLAEQIARLCKDSDLGDRLAQSGRETVLEKFTLERMVNEIEAYLLDCISEGAKSQLVTI